MRSLISATSISLGAISVGFSVVVFILMFAVSQVDPGEGLRGRIETGLVSLALGVALLGIGVLLRRSGPRSSAPVRE
jgi:hypothetical protein